jgi:hypothetical protein
MSKNITSFAAFLEQTERKPEPPEITRADSAPHAENASHVDSASRAKSVSGAENASRAEIHSEPVLKVRDADSAPHAESAPVRGHLRVPNEVLYNVLPTLKPSEAIVLLRLYAISHGFQKTTCTVSLDKLASGCNLSRTQTRVCVRALERKELIKSLGVDNTHSNRELRGLHFEVNLPAATRAESAPRAKNASHAESTPIKEKIIKRHTHKETTAEKASQRASRGVCVGSKFGLEDCQRYAEHLNKTGQGINNPGGFAMAIYRSGMADPLIAKFLDPGKESSPTDASDCPDCGGRGMYYPNGFDKGAAKCRHEKLAGAEKPSAQRLTSEEIDVQASIIAELLESGYTLEQAETQFGSGLSGGDWGRIIARIEKR